MKIHSVYTCEICNGEYLCESAARYCEATILEPCPLKIGDTVTISDRLQDGREDKIVKISIYRTMTAYSVRDYDEEEFKKFLPKFQSSKRLFHTYMIEVAGYHNIGRDESTNIFNIDNII